jgi:predicted DNA-binding transcriptional regulator YafY
MPRNSELIRQWEILRAIEGARTGVTVARLAADRGVHARTIKRDIDALCQAGFPLYDERVNGTVMWKLGAKPFRLIEDNGLGLTELAALYFSRSILVALAGPAFQNEMERALMKVERALPPAARRLVDRLPRLIAAKTNGRKKQDERRVHDITTRAFDALVRERAVTMRYRSASSGRVRDYSIEPQRMAYAGGGVYLTAWVPEYGQLRTFAIERIETFALGDERFVPRPLPVEPFANSIGVHSGPAERVEIEFDQCVADYVRGREWHRSQEIDDRGDGSIVLRLDVCNDMPLRSWILGFGSRARVLSPRSLVQQIGEQIDQARLKYRPRATLGMARMGLPGQDREPESKVASAS